MATKSLIDWLRYWSVHVCSRLKLDLLRLNSAFRHHVKSHKRLCKTLTPHISVIFLFLRESLRLQLIATCRHTFADGQTDSQAPLPPGGHITTFPAHRTADESRCEVEAFASGARSRSCLVRARRHVIIGMFFRTFVASQRRRSLSSTRL